VLCVQRFRDPAQALALANHPVYGLSASVFTRDVSRALASARGLKAGTVWVNRWGRTPEMMSSPFGGYGQSGFGKESGRAGIDNFLRSKSVWIDFAATPELSQGGRR
jgi:aldehyde dehydrogenase (NAD+)